MPKDRNKKHTNKGWYTKSELASNAKKLKPTKKQRELLSRFNIADEVVDGMPRHEATDMITLLLKDLKEKGSDLPPLPECKASISSDRKKKSQSKKRKKS